jgi:diguanylate cyclase (GGDEF)-like protein/PAS domain S-box-containing protein
MQHQHDGLGDDFFARLVASTPDGVAVLGPDGRVIYANDELARLMRLPLDELIGSDGLGMVHPDELTRALDGIAYAAEFPDRTAVVPYRLSRGDGTWVNVELKSRPLPDATPDGDGLILIVRDGTTRTSVASALTAVANGRPLADTARRVAEAVASRWPNTGVVVFFDAVDGAREVVSVDVPGVFASWAMSDDGDALDAPWATAAAKGESMIFALDEMPGALGEDAEAFGFRCCGVAPVADPGGRPACLIAWFDEPAAARFEFRHASVELTELLALALERRYHLAQLHHAARHDPLTGLRDRKGFFEQLDETIDDSSADASLALLFIDLDGFKPVNDRYGHVVGDRLLVDAARRLERSVGADEVVARLGGDEFAIVCRVPADRAAVEAAARADAVLHALREPMMIGGHGDGELIGPLRVAASVGVALVDGAVGVEAILDRADAAMYQAKSAGGARSQVWQPA